MKPVFFFQMSQASLAVNALSILMNAQRPLVCMEASVRTESGALGSTASVKTGRRGLAVKPTSMTADQIRARAISNATIESGPMNASVPLVALAHVVKTGRIRVHRNLARTTASV